MSAIPVHRPTENMSARPSASDGSLVISCDECVMQQTSACADCVVTFICGREPDEAVVIDAAEERALRLLARGGLLPVLRHAR